MEIEHLKEFLVYSQSLNYTTAAKELFMAQPTLSQHIAKLSADLGMPLVSQTGKPHLTPAGDVLCSYAQSMTTDYDGLLATLERMKSQQSRTIRIVDIRPSVDFASEVGAARAGCEDAPPRISYLDGKDLFQFSEFELLDNDLVDVSFTFAADASMDDFAGATFEPYGFVPLRPERCVMVLASDHPLARAGSLRSSDLAGMRVTTVKTPFWLRGEQAALAVLRARGLALPRTQGTARSKFILPANDFKYTAITYADAVKMNPTAYGDDLVTLPVSDFDFTIRPFAIYRKDSGNALLAGFMKRWESALASTGA